jgi:alkanesulfonate monooxygenase SsuD/methylene tetrahydromethanopterin reductase-like flavin-dependent oxidoreductase (luciferase family)
MNERLGVATGKPLSDIRAFVEKFKKASRIGELPPVVLAAMRDRMMSLGAEIGDGVVLANGARSALPSALARMRATQSISEGFFVGGMIPTCISDDREAAAEVNRKTMRMYVSLPNYRNYWKAAGYVKEMELIEKALSRGEKGHLMGLMTDEWLSDVTLYGSADEVRNGLDAWYEAGLTTPILVPSSTVGGQFTAFDELFTTFS